MPVWDCIFPQNFAGLLKGCVVPQNHADDHRICNSQLDQTSNIPAHRDSELTAPCVWPRSPTDADRTLSNAVGPSSTEGKAEPKRSLHQKEYGVLVYNMEKMQVKYW